MLKLLAAQGQNGFLNLPMSGQQVQLVREIKELNKTD
jgi:hypothetical protein